MRFCSENGIPHSEFLDWDPVDRAKQIAYMIEDAQRCQMCGTADWEWDADANAYTPVEHLCRGCYREKVYTEGKDLLPGTTVRLAKTDSAQVRKMRAKQERYQKE